MTSLIAGTWSLISSSAEVITGARRMTVRIQRLLKLEKIELSESDRRRLLGLQKRVECLVQPLNFLLLWSKKRDSCVQQAVLSAQELLFDVCGYVERFVPQDGAGSAAMVGGKPGSGPLDSEQLEYYLRELEFACASVSMAVNIAREIDAPLLHKPLPITQAGTDAPGVSLSALLRASRLIQEMRGRSGDLCACPGRLYSEAPRWRDSVLSDGPGKASLNGRGDAALMRQEGEEWAPMLSLATFKVVAAMDTRKGRRRYGISVESRRPLSQRESSPHRCSLDDADSQSPRGGLNAGGPLSFPIEVALDACLATTSRMALPAEPARCTRDLGIDSLVLLWGGVTTGIEVAGGEVNSEFPDVVLLPDVAAEAQGLPHPLRPNPNRLASANTLAARCPPGCSRFAFVFDGPRGIAEARSGDAEVALTPLDALYLARLCALDDGHHGAFSQDGCGDGAATCPPHLLSSDEVLMALLQEGTSASLAPTENGCRSSKCAHDSPGAGAAANNGTASLAWTEAAH